MADINKIGALCIQDKKLLVVHKKNVGYICLGGKIEPGESDENCLKREVKEEIGCEVKDSKYFTTFEGMNHDGTKTLRMVCYFCELEGKITITPEDSVDGTLWLGKDYEKLGDKVAHMLRAQIMPELLKRGLL